MSNELDPDSSDDEPSTTTPPDSRPPSPTNKRRKTEEPTSRRPSLSTNVTSACADLFLSERYSDILIIVEDTIYPVHRNVVCSQSEFFELALRGDFKEAHEGLIHIRDETPKDIYRVLYYLYKHDIIQHPSDSHTRTANGEEKYNGSQKARYALRTNLSMRRLADKFGIPGLEAMAVSLQLSNLKALGRDYNRAARNPELYLESIVTLASDLALRIYRQSEEEDDPLREQAKKMVFRLLRSAQMSAKDLKECLPLQSLIKEHGDFALEMMLDVLGNCGPYKVQRETVKHRGT
ncbi:hypothetical protein BJ508DRAFT_331864 [Ascobolus immersus RN42]|uniref:BTB domain-containing protein n=1 Tax=Ascobolus immersus RN42 TaxID=1160509 RepID=A0A3N4HP97_ASCIM|nr:hypothetical protein BJ508DRAFT_331864 [Ascobolus immersus RN42]